MDVYSGREYGRNGIVTRENSSAHLGDVIINNTVVLESARFENISRGLEQWKVVFASAKPRSQQASCDVIEDEGDASENMTTNAYQDETFKAFRTR